MWIGLSDTNACADMDVTLADFMHSNLFIHFFRVYESDESRFHSKEIYRRLQAPNFNTVSGPLLDTLYDINWNI